MTKKQGMATNLAAESQLQGFVYMSFFGQLFLDAWQGKLNKQHWGNQPTNQRFLPNTNEDVPSKQEQEEHSGMTTRTRTHINTKKEQLANENHVNKKHDLDPAPPHLNHRQVTLLPRGKGVARSGG